MKQFVGKIIVSAFAGLTPDIEGIYDSTLNYDLNTWQNVQISLATGSGTLGNSIPGFHLLGSFADITFLMNRMSVCSYGVGAILGRQANLGNILEDEDFAIVLARWSGDDCVSNATVAKTAAGLATQFSNKAIVKMLAKAAASNTGLLIGKKLGAKVSAKIVGKFAAKLGAKAVTGWLPFFGAAVGGSVNFWFISSITEEATNWYRLKMSIANGSGGQNPLTG